jgi:hypothetical protein
MIAKTGSNFDIILISGEYYDDHPLSPVGIIAKVLDAKGYRIGIIEKPEMKESKKKGTLPPSKKQISHESPAKDKTVEGLKRSSKKTEKLERIEVFVNNK